MNYEKLSGSIRAVIDRRPGDVGAYSDLFSLCREWETEDFSAAHKVNKELLALSADQVVRGGGVKFYEQWRRCLLFEAPHDFDSFMTYIELDRKPEKRFYAPRKHYLRPMVQGFQDVLDGKLRLLTISMPKRAGKSQTGINFVNKQYEYYTAGNSTIKKVNGSANSWWERSPRSGNASSFCIVSNYGNANNSGASGSFGVSFGFCV